VYFVAKVNKDWLIKKLENTDLNQQQVDAINKILSRSYVECPDCGKEIPDNIYSKQHHVQHECIKDNDNRLYDQLRRDFRGR
jgi:uncharacterized Zn-finger protein